MVSYKAGEVRESPILMVHGRIGNGNCSCGSRHDSQRASKGGCAPARGEAQKKAIIEARRREKAYQERLDAF